MIAKVMAEMASSLSVFPHYLAQGGGGRKNRNTVREEGIHSTWDACSLNAIIHTHSHCYSYLGAI